VLLTLGAEMLVRGSATLAKRMGISSFFIGLTIVGFGTSTPELGTGITAALRGVQDLNVGNVIGSNIVNIALIMGIGSLIAPTPVKAHLVRRETIIVIVLSFIPYLALMAGGFIPRWLGAVMVAALVVYLARTYFESQRHPERVDELGRELERELGLDRAGLMSRTPVSVVVLVAGMGLLILGAHFLVDSSTTIARQLGISDLVIGLTVVALGTSAPELFTTIVAALRRQSDIAIGNILGSNIFNLLGILGATSMVAPQRVSMQVFWLDAPLMIVLSIALVPIMTTRARISRGEGGLLVLVYVVYMLILFLWAPAWFSTSV
jgi:cation:H+ antiporter